MDGFSTSLKLTFQIEKAADAFPCVTTALHKCKARHGISQDCFAILKAFPVPGRLAGSLPINTMGCSTSRHSGSPPYYLWRQQLRNCELFTRLALQLILVKGFRLYSFQLPDLKKPGIVIYCHYLPVSGLGNLRACCLPWMW